MTKDLICVGSITGSYGVRGEARIRSFCAEPRDIETYSPLTTPDGRQRFDVKITRAIKGGFAARLSGVDQKEQADALKGTGLYAPRSALPTLPDEEFYHTDLVGLQVVDTGGEPVGTVSAVHDHGAGDILEITGPALKEPLLLPFTKTTVPTIDLTAGRLMVAPPEDSSDAEDQD
jgi:16S rRNA processing protein RimM